MCRRTPGDVETKTPIPTEVFNGYCPPEYFGLGLTGMTHRNQVATPYVLMKTNFIIESIQ